MDDKLSPESVDNSLARFTQNHIQLGLAVV